jgi:hypothetical protein
VERNHYQERQRAERDAANLAAESRMARQRGFDEGREKGIEKGEVIGRIRLLQQLLGHPPTASAELDRLPLPELVQQEETLARQFSSSRPANGSATTEKT